MTTPTRVRPADSRVDTSRTLTFTFDERRYTGHPGDTLASALLANGVRLLARSFKYGRPRGLIACGPEEPNALVQLEAGQYSTPNLKATQVELYDGLRAARTSGWPSLRLDLKSLLGLAGRFMPVGFYSKTFKWPARCWPGYEKLIRRFSGYGSAPVEPDADSYDHLNHHVDVLIIGGGLAGLLAARETAAAGLKTLLLDEQAEIGGWLLSDKSTTIDGLPPAKWRDQTAAALADASNLEILNRTTAFGLYDQNLVFALELLQDHLPLAARDSARPRQREHKIRARRIVLATGAIERPLLFKNNDRPGVMTLSAGQTYLNRYGVLVGRRIVIVGGHDGIYDAAADFSSAGARVAVADLRSAPATRRPPAGVTVYRGYGIKSVLGRRRVRAVSLQPLITAASGETICGVGRPLTIAADAVLTSAALAPTVHLFCHDGGRPVWNDSLQAYCLPTTGRQGIACVGAVTGAFDTEQTITQTHQAIRQLLQELNAGSIPPPALPVVALTVRDSPLHPLRLPDSPTGASANKTFVDFQNDVTVADIHLAVRENYQSIEHVKRYTALGFGTDQGKLSNINGFIVAAQALGKPVHEVGTTTYRPAYTPVTFGALAGPVAGAGYDPVRVTPIHAMHEQAGAIFEPVGQWQRARYYPRHRETMAEAVARECTAARRQVAMMDASTLGKIQIDGPDAREFLNRIYANDWSRLAPGKCRYGLMLDENGMVMDDGVGACLADNSFLITTTTGGAANVLNWLETWHQTEWPELRLWMTSVTDHWATIVITGPDARRLLAATDLSIDLDAQAFPFMSWREGTIAGLPVRVFRVSFSGELAFEINVEAAFATTLWQTLQRAGEPLKLTLYGTETMHVLRAEKGFIIVGQDTDGSVTPYDLGMDWAVAMHKAFSFVGKRSLTRSDTARTDRRQWVGLLPHDPLHRIAEGAQLINTGTVDGPTLMLGHVTSSYYSPWMQRSFALGLLESGRDRLGQTLYAYANGKTWPVEVVSPIMVDPEGTHQRV